MKTILTIICMLSLVLTINAQSDNDYLELSREVLKVEKKVAIAQNMNLTDAESTEFWILYGDYENDLYKIHNQRIAIINDYADNYEKLTDEKSDELWTNYISYQSELLKFKKSYYKKFKKILPTGKAARFFQIENKIEAMVNAVLALEIPLMETK